MQADILFVSLMAWTLLSPFFSKCFLVNLILVYICLRFKCMPLSFYSLEVSENERSPSARNLTTLRIKSEKGDHTYILKMKFTDTIGDVRDYIDKQR